MPDKTASIEAIIAEIRQQAGTEIETVRQAAAREQSQIKQRAQTETEKIRAGIINKARLNAEQYRKRSVAQANLEIKKLNLQSQLLISVEIQRQFEERLFQLRQTPEYAQLLKELIVEGIIGLGADNIRLSAGDREKQLLTDDFIKSVRVAVNSPVQISLDSEVLSEPGIILYSADKRMRFDNRLTRYGQRLFEKYQWKIMQKFSEHNQKG